MKIRIMSLGEIVTIDLQKSLSVFTDLLVQKGLNAKQAEMAVSQLLLAKYDSIKQFKLGAVSEDAFDQQMISAFSDIAGVELSKEEFNCAWNAMLPEVADFQDALVQAVYFDQQPGQKLILVSNTNAKDMRFLKNQLENNNIEFSQKDGFLVSVAGIELQTTCANQCSKAELVKNVLARLDKSTKYSFGLYANHQQDVKYLLDKQSVSNLTPELIRDAVSEEIKQVDNILDAGRINTILWDKSANVSLLDALNINNLEVRSLPVGAL